MGFKTPVYRASTTLVVASSAKPEISQNTAGITSSTATEVTVNSKLVATYSELVKSKNILRQVISNLNMKLEEDELRKNITVSSVKETELIEITVINENPSYSAKIANEIAKVFTEKVKEIYNIENVQVVDEAEVPSEPSNISHKKDIAIFAIVGLVISIGYVLILNMLDTTVKTPEDIEEGLKLPVLAAIPVYETDIQKTKGGRK
jgi:capsular polysaccharide biosynthesis protein